MFALLKEPCVMTQVSALLCVMHQIGRNVAFMFYHKIIKICDFRPGSILTIKHRVIFQKIEIHVK